MNHLLNGRPAGGFLRVSRRAQCAPGKGRSVFKFAYPKVCNIAHLPRLCGTVVPFSAILGRADDS